MNKDILISGPLALAIHALIFSLPLLQTMKDTYTPTGPISISILHSQKTLADVPLVEVSAEIQTQPRFEERTQQPIISQKKIASKEVLADSPTVQRGSSDEVTTLEPVSSGENQEDIAGDIPLDHLQQGQDKEVDSNSSVSTASIASDGERQGERHQDARSGDEAILDARPKYKDNPPPDYPSVARRRGYEGRTVLRVEVLENGNVGQVDIAASSGFEVLDKAALVSVKDWTFVAGTRAGKKMRQWVMVPVKFSLR